jgi:protein-tyrosine phosphatase
VFHCVTGKDRTRVLASLIYGVLGVDGQTILEDFRMSQLGMDRLVSDLRARGKIGADEQANPALGVPVPAMEHMLEVLRTRHGGAVDFLRAR